MGRKWQSGHPRGDHLDGKWTRSSILRTAPSGRRLECKGIRNGRRYGSPAAARRVRPGTIPHQRRLRDHGGRRGGEQGTVYGSVRAPIPCRRVRGARVRLSTPRGKRRSFAAPANRYPDWPQCHRRPNRAPHEPVPTRLPRLRDIEPAARCRVQPGSDRSSRTRGKGCEARAATTRCSSTRTSKPSTPSWRHLLAPARVPGNSRTPRASSTERDLIR
jgi:hypothetical protein